MPLKPGGSWSARLHPLQNRSQDTGLEPCKRLFPGRPNPTFRPTAMPPLSCPHEMGETPCSFPCLSSSYTPLCLPLSFPLGSEPCSWPRLYLSLLLAESKSKSKSIRSERKTLVLLKPVSGRSGILAARPFKGSRLIATSTPFSWKPYFLLAVADFYSLVLAGFCPILSISCTFLFRFSVLMHGLFPLREFKL